MIRLSRSGFIIYHMLSQIVILLVAYACLTLLDTVQPLVFGAGASQQALSQLTERIFHLIVLTGMITAGLVQVKNRPIVQMDRLYRLWWVLILISFLPIASPFPMLLDLFTFLLLFAYIALIGSSQKTLSPIIMVWLSGMVLVMMSLLLPYVVADGWHISLKLLRVYMAYGVVGVSMIFWLMTRWSNVHEQWVADGVLIVAMLVAIAGCLIGFAPLQYAGIINAIATMAILIAYTIYAGHGYRALRDRTSNMSLSPHWVAIAVLVWLIGGLWGAVMAQSGLQRWFANTLLQAAQIEWMGFGMLAIVLAFVNQVASDLRGENRRVTGYMPLWLIGFGQGAVTIMTICMGVVDIYLSQLLNLSRLSVDVLLTPLVMIKMIGLLIVACGIATYAMGFWVRRPQIIVTDA